MSKSDIIRKHCVDNNIPIVEIKCASSSVSDCLGSPLSKNEARLIGENLIADLMDQLGHEYFINLHNKMIAMAQATTIQPSLVKSNGMKCSGACGEFNQYAEPNQSDGSFCCYSCRKR